MHARPNSMHDPSPGEYGNTLVDPFLVCFATMQMSPFWPPNQGLVRLVAEEGNNLKQQQKDGGWDT